jgi:hypothetical protein
MHKAVAQRAFPRDPRRRSHNDFAVFDTSSNPDARESLTGILSALNWYCNNSGPKNAHLENGLHRIERNAAANRSV